jgi:hypothetical protein
MHKNDMNSCLSSPAWTHQKNVPLFGLNIKILDLNKMKLSELAHKKIDLFVGTEHTDKEIEFIKKHIYDLEPKIKQNCGIALDDFFTVSDRCHMKGGRVIGIETRADSNAPFFSFTWEDFCKMYDEDWLWHPYIELLANDIENHIIIIMDFPANLIDDNSV